VRTAVLFLYAASLCAGCGFHSVDDGGDGSAGADDMGAGGDLASNDDLWGVAPGSDLAHVSGGGSCAPPVLLVGVENLHNGDTGGGRVARLSLSQGSVTPCTTLRGQGLIGPQPFAVAQFSGGVGAAAIDGLYVVDPISDTIKWMKPAAPFQDALPLDAFYLYSPMGKMVIAVAYTTRGSNPSSIREIDAFDEQGNAQPGAQPWCIQGTQCTSLPLSLSILGMTTNPGNLSHFLALDSANDVGAWDVDPWATPPTKTQYVGAYSGYLQSIYSTVANGTLRLAWWDGMTTAGAIRYASDPGSGPSTVAGPITCASGCTTMIHVVPDPTTPDGFFALCDGPTVDARTVVRMDSTHACTVVLDGKPFGAESRLSRLGLWD
jgi:hypothetical protein